MADHPDTSDTHDGSSATRHDPVYDELAARPEFARLRYLYRRFIIPASVVFLAWYGLYVVMSMFAPGFMNTVLFSNINVALVFGLLQFVSTFGIAYLYSRYSNTHLDPLAGQLASEYDAVLVARTNGNHGATVASLATENSTEHRDGAA